MNRERLLKLAQHMERVDPKNYYQGLWLGGLEENDYTVEGEENRRIVIREGSCGTTMCVLGHAVVALPDAGLWFYCIRHGITHVMHRDPETEIVTANFAAAREAFDIPEEHARVLFGGPETPTTYLFYADRHGTMSDFHTQVTPSTVAKKLREYVETDGEVVDVVRRHYGNRY
jgi:hypothetical protein